MPKALAQFKPGQKVSLECYHHWCAEIELDADLDKEITSEIHPRFLGSERIRWTPGTPVRLFRLRNNVYCPWCKNTFSKAFVVSNGPSKKPTIFGYESEPA